MENCQDNFKRILGNKLEKKRGGGGGNLLVHLDTNSSLGNVPYATGTAMVELVRHTLVNGTVNFYVNIVSDSVDP